MKLHENLLSLQLHVKNLLEQIISCSQPLLSLETHQIIKSDSIIIEDAMRYIAIEYQA
jgi:hypothetical protein